jgi:hypothetical protein
MAAVALALLLHGAALIALREPMARGTGGDGRPGPRVMLLAAIVAPIAPNSVVASPVTTATHHVNEAPLAPEASGTASTAPGSPLLGLARALPEEDYADWRQLTVLPSAREDVDLPERAMEALQRVGKATLTLFIDDVGAVVRVRVEASSLPPEVEDAVRLAFYQAPFTPGFIGDHAVPVRLQVEVVFESGPSTPNAPTLARADTPA